MITPIVILAAVALALIALDAAHGNAVGIGIADDLQAFTQPVDLPAFLNLVDPREEQFLRVSLTPQVFRRVQRHRLFAAREYVRRVAKNAAVMVRLGEAAKAEGKRRNFSSRAGTGDGRNSTKSVCPSRLLLTLYQRGNSKHSAFPAPNS